MKIVRGIKNTGKRFGRTFLNFSAWMGTDTLRGYGAYINQSAKRIMKPAQAEVEETFEEAMKREGLTEADIQKRQKHCFNVAIAFLGLGVAVFAYSIYLLWNGHLMALLLGVGVTGLSLVQAFRYHFWYFQMKQRKLGCTFKEWLNS